MRYFDACQVTRRGSHAQVDVRAARCIRSLMGNARYPVDAAPHVPSGTPAEPLDRGRRGGRDGSPIAAIAQAASAALVGNERYRAIERGICGTGMGGLRHRVVLNFEARAEGVEPDRVVRAALDAVPETTA